MKALWGVAYVLSITAVVVCLIVNFCTTFAHSLAQSCLEHAEKKLRAQRGRA